MIQEFCKLCNGILRRDFSLPTIDTYPEQHAYRCVQCNNIEYLFNIEKFFKIYKDYNGNR